MPKKLNMFISNGNYNPSLKSQINAASLGGVSTMPTTKAPSALNAPIISRIHNVKGGCGSCGRS